MIQLYFWVCLYKIFHIGKIPFSLATVSTWLHVPLLEIGLCPEMVWCLSQKKTEKSSYEKRTVVAKEVLATKVSSANQAIVWRGDDPKSFIRHPSTTHWGPDLLEPQIWVPGKGRVGSPFPSPTGLWKEREGVNLKVRGLPISLLWLWLKGEIISLK